MRKRDILLRHKSQICDKIRIICWEVTNYRCKKKVSLKNQNDEEEGHSFDLLSHKY